MMKNSLLIVTSACLALACAPIRPEGAEVAPGAAGVQETSLQCPETGIPQARNPEGASEPRIKFMPNVPLSPSELIGTRAYLYFIVDVNGHPVRSSIVACNVPDAKYARRLANAWSRARFHPGKVGQRPVRTQMVFSLTL